jgi:nucleotide-binding universal stress UspA family protein
MKILLAFDGSPTSRAAIAEICRRPWPANTHVHLIAVDRPVDPSFLTKSPPSVFDEIVELRRIELKKELDDAVKTISEKASGVHVTSALLEGWPKDTIVAEAERFGADLVVVGSHGYGPIRRFFLGSVSLFVAHHAPCSVLIVRQPPEIEPDAAETST